MEEKVGITQNLAMKYCEIVFIKYVRNKYAFDFAVVFFGENYFIDYKQ